MYVDRLSPLDVRGSIQYVYGFCVLSLGFFVGGIVGVVVGETFTSGTSENPIRDWPSIWLSCAAICAVAVFCLWVGFREGDEQGVVERAGEGDADGEETPMVSPT